MSKLTTLDQAVASIPSGSHIALSGFAITRCNMAFAREVIRQGLRGLTISHCVGAMDGDLLVGAGAVERLIYGGGSLDRFGRLACVNRAIENGTLIAEEYSSLSIAFRYLAGSLGLPFIPIRSIRGSDLMHKMQAQDPTQLAMIKDPFTGDDWLALKPLLPDVAVVQVQIADADGNACIFGPRWDNVEQAKAAKRTIVIAEQVVDAEEIRRHPEQTVLPALIVSHVVELPFSAHPTSVYRSYDYDAEAIKGYVAGTDTPDNLKQYLDRYVYGVRNHWEYLECVGGTEKLSRLRAEPVRAY